jgi:FkbM family methyltransferase
MQPSPVRRVIKRVLPFAVRNQIWRTINRVRGWNERRLSAPKITWNTATEQDLYYCCRLLMGREPDQNELHNFGPVLRQRGMTREALVQVYLEQPEFLERQARRAAFSGFDVVEMENFRLYVPPSSVLVGDAISEHQLYEPHVTAMLRRHLKPGMTVVDVGANIGYLSMVAAVAVGPGGKVLCFEPDAERCVMLQLSIEANHYSHVEVFPFAVADRVRNMIYDANAGTGTTSSLDGEFIPTPQRSLVRAVTLDATLRDEPSIDILKMDIDGAEALALRGAQELLKRHRPLIFTEFCPPLLLQISGVEPLQYLEALLELDYELSIIGFSGDIIECGRNVEAIMQYIEQRSMMYVDLLAVPRGR